MTPNPYYPSSGIRRHVTRKRRTRERTLNNASIRYWRWRCGPCREAHTILFFFLGKRSGR